MLCPCNKQAVDEHVRITYRVGIAVRLCCWQDTIDSAYDTVKGTLAQEGLPLVGLVNNAGIAASSPVEYDPEERVRSVFEVNYFGALWVTQKFLALLKQAQGRVINVSSVAGLMTAPLSTTYCATKHALEALSDGLRMEMSLYNVSVSVIEPAYVTSEIFYKNPKPDPRALEGYVFWRCLGGMQDAGYALMRTYLDTVDMLSV
jgi:short-subunit dehydrogenase